MSAIQATGIRKGFGAGETRVEVLRGVDFSARDGEMTFIVGPSGCGKTTLISILAGLLSADQGTVSVFGTDILSLKGKAQTRFRGETIGFVFQQFNLLPALDAAENAAIPLIAQGMGFAAARKKACALLETLGLGASLAKFPRELSGGQQQRVAIARALIHDPHLIVCDEPTASLDAAAGHDVMMLLRSLAVKPGRAAIMVTHDDRIFSFADAMAFMADGLVVRNERRDGAGVMHTTPEE